MTTLTEMLNEEKKLYVVKFTHEGLETTIRLNKHLADLSVSSAHLFYVKQFFEKSPQEYLAHQVFQHHFYLQLLQKIVEHGYTKLQRHFDFESDTERARQFVPEGMLRSLVGAVKVFAAPLSWLQGTTFQREMQKEIEENKKILDGYRSIAVFLDYGKQFWEELRELPGRPAETDAPLQECQHLTDELSVAAGRAVLNAEKEMAALTRSYHFFFPSKRRDEHEK